MNKPSCLLMKENTTELSNIMFLLSVMVNTATLQIYKECDMSLLTQ